MYYFLIIPAIIVADRVIKIIVESDMFTGESIALVGDAISITYVRNTGAAFSFFADHTLWLILLTALLCAVALIFMFVRRSRLSGVTMTALAMIIGGGIGNLIDRIMNGYVVDYISIMRFPVFNLADICITLGCVIFIIAILFGGEGRA